jgi:hypothetical protein
MWKIVGILLLFAGMAFGSANCPQVTNADQRPYDAAINEVFNPPGGAGTEVRDLVDLQQSYPCFTQYVLLHLPTAKRIEVFRRVFADLQPVLKSISKSKAQTGSSSASGGSTNLVTKGTTAQIVSLASEYGALTESKSNQTVTFQGTLDGPFQAARRQYLIGYCEGKAVDPYCISPKADNVLSRFSYGVTFNTSASSQTVSGSTTTPAASGSTQQATFTASGRQIASITGQYSWNSLGDTTSTEFKKAWNCLFKDSTASPSKGTPTAAHSPNTSQDGTAAALKAASTPDASSAQCKSLAGQTVTDQDLLTALKVQSNVLVAFLKTLGLPANPTVAGQLPDDDPTKAFLQYYLGKPGKPGEEAPPSWWSDTQKELESDKASGDQAKFTQDFYDAIAELADHLPENGTLGEQITQRAANLVRTAEVSLFMNALLIHSIADKPILTVEGEDDRPQNQNSYVTLRMILEKSWGKDAGWTATSNGAVALNVVTYSSVPGSSTYRDAQAGLEVKRTLGNLNVLGQALGAAALSATYYFQHQNSPATLNVTPGTPLTGITIRGLPSTATQVFAAAGDINIGQLRLEIGSGSNLKFPIAVSYSNRTELITKPEFRAQIGLSYNFDLLLTGSGQGSQK